MAMISSTGSLQIGGRTPVVKATYSRPADNTAYQAGDLIGNSVTAASVVPVVFDFAPLVRGPTRDGVSGLLTGARSVVKCASGTIVLTALIFDLYLFRAATDTPFAAAGYPADNAPVLMTAAASKEILAVIPFVQAKWRNRIGANAAAGDFLYQEAPVSVSNSRLSAPFNLNGATAMNGLIVAQGAWTPTGIVNTFDFELDVVLD